MGAKLNELGGEPMGGRPSLESLTDETGRADDRRANPDAVGPASFAAARGGMTAVADLVGRAATAMGRARRVGGPLPAGTMADVLGSAASTLGPARLAETGLGVEPALAAVARVLGEQGLNLAHPRAVAHLQPPALSVAVAADALASAGNASVDTYDSGPAAIAIERWVIEVLARLARLGPTSAGVLTPGGSLSNLLGLLLARDAAALRRGGDARRDGATALAGAVVFCSELAHFSVHRACAALGLGEAAVRALPVDEHRRLRPETLAAALDALRPSEIPVAIVATAGTTDFGSIDPLPALAALAASHGLWLHVDAAYGFGALFSDTLAERLEGLNRADSITLDLHKLGWQPAPASVLLVRDAAAFAALEREVAYLNPQDDVEAGLDGLLGRSLQTTRRPDAVKIAATMLAYGRRGLGTMVDACHALAQHATRRVLDTPELELVGGAALTTVVFRYRRRDMTPPGSSSGPIEDRVNGQLRRQLLQTGRALIGRTTARLACDAEPRVCLKLTLLNPLTTPGELDELLAEVVAVGRDVERRLQGWAS